MGGDEVNDVTSMVNAMVDNGLTELFPKSVTTTTYEVHP